MFTRNTVFILGAGSNFDYGFYLSEDLKAFIANKFIGNYSEYLKQNGSYSNEHIEFMPTDADKIRTIINSSTHTNIDHLLGMHPQLEKIGKFAIIDAILCGEGNSISFSNQILYLKLFDMMKQGIFTAAQAPNILQNKVSFITFNYDRSLEMFFYNQLTNFADWSSSNLTVKDVFDQLIQIYHVYGSLGSPFQGSNDYLPYGQRPNLDILSQSSYHIDVIYGSKSIRYQNTIESLLQNADAIFFLGFGYDNDNLKILKLPQIVKPKSLIYGSGIKLSPEKRNAMNSLFSNHGQAVNHKAVGNLNCIDFIDHIVEPYSRGRNINALTDGH